MFSGTCFDGIHDPDEEGKDCGGKCFEPCGITYVKCKKLFFLIESKALNRCYNV